MNTTIEQLKIAIQSVLHTVRRAVDNLNAALSRKAESPDWQENDAASLSHIKGRVGGYMKDGEPVKFPAEYLPEVDSEISDTSTNAVQNDVVKKYIDDSVQGTIRENTFGLLPTELLMDDVVRWNSNNMVSVDWDGVPTGDSIWSTVIKERLYHVCGEYAYRKGMTSASVTFYDESGSRLDYSVGYTLVKNYGGEYELMFTLKSGGTYHVVWNNSASGGLDVGLYMQAFDTEKYSKVAIGYSESAEENRIPMISLPPKTLGRCVPVFERTEDEWGTQYISVRWQGDAVPNYGQSTNGKVLGVEDGALKWVNLTGILPTHTAADNGKVLGIVDGALAWVDKGGVVEEVLFDDTVTIGYSEINGHFVNLENNTPFVAGQMYKVILDGVTYYLTAKERTDSAGAVIVGNQSIWIYDAENTGEPFMIQSNGTAWSVVTDGTITDSQALKVYLLITT